ncbi:HAD-IIB family hydrolase [Piscirickettsia litoralis]|uniref:Hydrolase n=1 Tax=Piscirickettsia litoralis TaxID=1891921 RepID=A0ABX3AC04_9GAMM|nr:HAD-IIB family hydrolase [Piscirickettsia litoralis]ODN43664.1 hypothetical protein BGC07_13070 [Piscirickettsia litoralis]
MNNETSIQCADLKYVVLDVDGTILEPDSNISWETEQAILALVESDFEVIFATARPYRDAIPVLPKSLQHLTIIGCNGGLIYENHQLVTSMILNNQLVEEALALLNAHDIAFVVDGVLDYATCDKYHDFYHYLEDEPKALDAVLVNGVVKIMVLDEHQPVLTRLNQWENEARCTLQFHRNEVMYAVSAPGVNKLQGIKTLGLDPQKCIMFGNDLNDLELLRHAGQAYVVGESLTTAERPSGHVHISAVGQVHDHLLKLALMASEVSV